MATARGIVTQTMKRWAEQMADEAGSWLRATSRVNGRSFYIVPSSTGAAAYYTTFYGCTCKGFMYRSVCAHVEAVKIMERRRMTEMAADAAFQAENDALFAGYTKHEVDPAPALPDPKAAPRRKMTYAELFPEDETLVDAY